MVNRLHSRYRDLIEQQSGVLARWQVTGGPPDLAALDGLVRRGRWRTLYRGVYAASGDCSRTAALWAAVRRCGPDAALSHFTAAELDRITDDRRAAIHVTIPGQARVRISAAEYGLGLPRIVVHRSQRLDAARHPAKVPPRTRVAETVLDLTDVCDGFDAAFSWLSAGCARRLVTPAQLLAAAKGRTKLRWRSDILGALDEIADGVSSNLESRFVRNVERPHRLPAAQRQARRTQGSRSAYLDNLYAEYGLAVELDGLAAHPAETRWQDIHRDNHFAATGIVTLRYSWADVTVRPCRVAGQIAMVLARRGWTGTLRRCQPSCPAVAP